MIGKLTTEHTEDNSILKKLCKLRSFHNSKERPLRRIQYKRQKEIELSHKGKEIGIPTHL